MNVFQQAMKSALELELAYNQIGTRVAEKRAMEEYQKCIELLKTDDPSVNFKSTLKNVIQDFIDGRYQIVINDNPRLARIGFEVFTQEYSLPMEIEPQVWCEHEDNYILMEYLEKHFEENPFAIDWFIHVMRT